MAKTWSTKQNDTKPIFSYLEDSVGRIDLTNATGVVFNMRDLAGTVKVSRGACTIVTASQGYVKYEFLAADTDTAGIYKGEFEVTYSGGEIETHPEDSYIPIKIIDDIA